MKNNILFIFIFLLISAGNVYADGKGVVIPAPFKVVKIQAMTNKTTMTTDESLYYELDVLSADKYLPEPELPDFEGFILDAKTRSKYQKGSGIAVVYKIFLFPKRLGIITIGPASVTIRGTTFTSGKIDVEVTQGQRVLPPEKSKPKSPFTSTL